MRAPGSTAPSRRGWRRDDDGSLPFAMLLVVVGVGLSTVLMATVMQQLQTTRVERARMAALDGARTGLASALANIRNARDTDGAGLVSALPCATAGVPQITGVIGGDTVQYRSTIVYLTQNPAKHDLAWITANGKPCAGQLGGIPGYAYVVSTGIEPATGQRRTLFGTYAFRSMINGNVPGGQIHAWKSSGSTYDLCLDAGPTPSPGAEVRLQICADLPDGSPVARQMFGYQPNLTITLVTADPVSYPQGLCLDAGSSPAAKSVVKLQLCGTTTVLQQQWSYNYASGFFGTRDGKSLDDQCFSVDKPDVPGSRLVLNDTHGNHGSNPACNTNYPSNIQTFVPDTDVGAGAAGLPVTKQLVNFGQFGRCLDVTNEDVRIQHEVVFQCKQNPDVEVRDWNQKWELPPSGVGQIWTTAPEGRYCLTMPTLGSPPLLVTVTNCTADNTSERLTWRIRGSATPTRDESYRIEGTGVYDGYCLGALPEAPAWQQADKAGITACTGSRLLKWNAVPDSSPFGFTSIGER
jgi:hypothetical protein